eukprot:149916_1
MDLCAIKEQIVCGYMRHIESLISKSCIIPTSLLWLTLRFIDDHDQFLSTYWKTTMHREIISIQIGQCGNNIGCMFWEHIGNEHKVGIDGEFTGNIERSYGRRAEDEDRLDKIHVYYDEVSGMRYMPRVCCIDLEPGYLEIIRTSSIRALFKPNNMCFGTTSAGNNWAKGYLTEGAELIDDAMDIIRQEVELCNSIQGFQLTHSIGGGTGGGMGSLVLLKLRDEYPDKIVSTFTVYPSPKVSDVVVEPYNATLSIHHLLEEAHQTFVIDNEALFSICHNVLKQHEPKYQDLNWVSSMAMCGATTSLRFDAKLNCDLRTMCGNLVPFPRLHFFLLAQAPLFAPGTGKRVKLTLMELEDQMWSSRNFLANIKSEDGKYITAACLYRGSICGQHQYYDSVPKIQCKMADDFVNWIPNNIKETTIRIPSDLTGIAGTFVANTTAMKSVFQRISARFAKMYKRKAFLHWYKGEGMDEMQLQEADKNVRELITEYQDKQDAVVDLEDDDEESDEGEEDESVTDDED